MRKYICAFGEEVDLDNPETYKHLPDDLRKLDDMMFKEIGQTLVYMNYFRKEYYPTNDKQRKREKVLIKNFAENRHNNHQNIMWYKEQIFLFQDETENMC
jgi:hypothetical protein